MMDAKEYLARLFTEFEKIGYSDEQIVAALYDYYEKEMMAG